MDLYTMEGQKMLEEHLRCRTTRVLEENAKQVESSLGGEEEEDAAADEPTATGEGGGDILLGLPVSNLGGRPTQLVRVTSSPRL